MMIVPFYEFGGMILNLDTKQCWLNVAFNRILYWWSGYGVEVSRRRRHGASQSGYCGSKLDIGVGSSDLAFLAKPSNFSKPQHLRDGHQKPLPSECRICLGFVQLKPRPQGVGPSRISPEDPWNTFSVTRRSKIGLMMFWFDSVFLFRFLQWLCDLRLGQCCSASVFFLRFWTYRKKSAPKMFAALTGGDFYEPLAQNHDIHCVLDCQPAAGGNFYHLYTP